MIHPERFGEIVARNRGADARVFTDEAEAIKLAPLRLGFCTASKLDSTDRAGGSA